MTAREWMKAHVAEYGNAVDLANGAIGRLGLANGGAVYRRAQQVWDAAHGTTTAKAARPAASPPAVARPKRRTFAELRETHDLSYQIPKAIEQVASEYLTGGGWLPDSEFLAEVLVHVPRARQRWAQYRDSEKYKAMQVRIDGRLLWIDPKYRDDAERIKA